MNKHCSILMLLLLTYLLSAKNIELKAVISGGTFHRSDETITLTSERSIYPENNKKVRMIWTLKDQSGKVYAENVAGVTLTTHLPEGKYTVELTINYGKQNSSDSYELFVAEKDMVKVTMKLYPPADTPESDYIFIGHDVPGRKDWTPYATLMERKSDGLWYADFNLKAGVPFRFQPTRGSWANKARDDMDSDFITKYIPYKDEIVEIKNFTWGKFVDKPDLVREPLLVPMTDNFTEMKLIWNTPNSELFYGESGKEPQKGEVINFNYGMECVLKNLDRGKTYFYQLGTDGIKYEFTIPDDDGKFVFAAGADGQNIKSTIEASAKKMVSYKPSLIVLAGDSVNNGLKASSWDISFFKPFVPFVQGTPIISAAGNHEEGSVLFNRYWGKKYNWNTYVCENTRFLIIDVEGTYVSNSIQYKFIEETLKNNKSKWLVVVMHESPYAFIPRHYSNLLARELLSPLFEKYKVNLVLAGHNHVYERTKNINGVTYVSLPCLGSNKPQEAVDPKNEQSEVQVFGKDGYAIIDVDNNRLDVKVETPKGELIDNFKITE